MTTTYSGNIMKRGLNIYNDGQHMTTTYGGNIMKRGLNIYNDGQHFQY